MTQEFCVPGWPDGTTPVVDDVQVAPTVIDGQEVAMLRFTDQLGNAQDICISERATWLALQGLLHFLRTTHSGTHCRRCGATMEEHPNVECPHWH